MKPSLLVAPPTGQGVVFVTGAGGFLGGHVVRAYIDAGWRVAGFALRDISPDQLARGVSGLKWITGPVSHEALRDASAAFGRPDLIIHTAGGSSVGASLADPVGDFQRTLGSIVQVLNFMRDGQAARLLFLSSAAVYGAVSEDTIDETAERKPISPYGVHKALAEDLVLHWSAIYGLSSTIIRFFSIYGPEMRKQLLWDLANRASAGGVLEMSGTGEERRDFLHVDDAVRLIGLLGQLPAHQSPKVINGGGGQASTVRAVTESLLAALEAPMSVQFNGQVREGDPRSLVAGYRTLGDAGFAPSVSLEEGLASFASWFRRQKVKDLRP